MKKKILAVGNAETELTCCVTQIPLVSETTVEAGSHTQSAGGGGLYTAAALARLGAESELCACVGTDAQGERIRRYCVSEGIDTRFLFGDKAWHTAFRLNLAEQNGARRSVFYPGAFSELRRDHVEEAFTSRPDGVCVSLELTETMLRYVSETADEFGAKLFIDAAGYNPVMRFDELVNVRAFICDGNEAGRITRILPDTIDNCLKAAVQLSTMLRASYYLIKLRDRGVFLYDGKYCSLVSPVERETLDKRAAREAFAAAFAYAMLVTGEAENAARFAGIAEALCDAKEGGCSSLPRADDIERYCRKNNIY